MVLPHQASDKERFPLLGVPLRVYVTACGRCQNQTALEAAMAATVARYGLDLYLTVAVELCWETSVQELSPYLGSPDRMSPTYAFKILEILLLVPKIRMTVGRIIRPKFLQTTLSCYCDGSPSIPHHETMDELTLFKQQGCQPR